MDFEKIPRLIFPVYKLESESSTFSNDDTESVYSIQDKETDLARDTSDTEHQSLGSEYELEIEYDVDSLSECDTNSLINCSDESDDDDNIVLAAAAAVIADNSFDHWVTDGEDSDMSSSEETSFSRPDYWTCVKCKSQNNNPLFRYCEKCFQARKTLFPPRPRHKKSRKSKKPESPVKLDNLRSCLNGLSQDSGIGSSQEFPLLGLDKIIVPQHLTENSSIASGSIIAEDEDIIPSSQLSEASSSISDKRNPKMVEPATKFDVEMNRIVWIDMEMTGLDIDKDKIMEVACLITDSDLNIVAEGPNIIIHQPKEVLDNMNEWCKNQHGKTGLSEECAKSTTTIEEAEEKLLNFVEANVTEKVSPLAGNSVYMDRLFLRKFMKNVDDHLHYRIIDVSTIKEVCRRWNGEVYSSAPKKGYGHRALNDIRESIEELKYYKNNFFNVDHPPK
ncbi:hypothetical protein WA026_014410 [Henosepilachna vigintioctopunctata]|uniref:Probable oligoribonuclease n=1 Tax=Henosepilachna vigintioctopunctata TaxID=420089 RepID=A0AAW1UEX3_9CUCU